MLEPDQSQRVQLSRPFSDMESRNQ